MKKLTKKERLIKVAVFKGVKNIGHLKNELNQNEKPLLLALNRMKRAGMFTYEIIGRSVVFTPSQKAVKLAISL